MLDKTKNAKDFGIATHQSSAIKADLADTRGFASFVGPVDKANEEMNLHDAAGFRYKTLAELIGDNSGANPAHAKNPSARESGWSPELDTYHQLPGLRSFWPPG